MRFVPTNLAGAWIVELEPHEDDRGFFARSFCAREFEAYGLDPRVAQCNVSFNRTRGTLRGMHAQIAPHAEAKLVRCTRGAIHDVIVDVRQGSATYLEHFGTLLDDSGRRALYVPEGMLHGFLTLQDDTEVFYQMSEFYAPGAARGYRYDDPTFAIDWPAEVTVIAPRDLSYPPFGSPGGSGGGAT